MGQSNEFSDDQLLGKKERSEEPKGYDLLQAADALGFSRNELDELDRLYKSEQSGKVINDGSSSAKGD